MYSSSKSSDTQEIVDDSGLGVLSAGYLCSSVLMYALYLASIILQSNTLAFFSGCICTLILVCVFLAIRPEDKHSSLGTVFVGGLLILTGFSFFSPYLKTVLGGVLLVTLLLQLFFEKLRREEETFRQKYQRRHLIREEDRE